MLDSCCSIETPEGVDLELTPAGIGSRAMAYAIDILIRSLIYAVAAIVMGFAKNLGWGLFLILAFLLEWFYPVYFEVFRDGVTPGKKRVNLRVVHDDGTPVTFASSVIRNLLRFVDFMPLFYGVAFVSMALTSKFKRLGDMAAGTMVVYTQDLKLAKDIDEEDTKNVPLPLTINEQRSVISYAERCNELSVDRAKELANILEPVLQCSDEQAVTSIKKIAKGLVIGH